MNHKRLALLLISVVPLAIFLLIWIASLVRTTALNQQRILFEVVNGSSWPSGKMGGVFITATGDIFQFEIKNRFLWLVPKRDAITYKTSDLYRWYGLFPKKMGELDRKMIISMVGLIEPASKSGQSEKAPDVCYDSGYFYIIAFIYDGETKLHTPILLYSAGDYNTGKNTSSEGELLIETLKNINHEYGNSYHAIPAGCWP